jgi:CRP-like cAMP-binding protein
MHNATAFMEPRRLPSFGSPLQLPKCRHAGCAPMSLQGSAALPVPAPCALQVPRQNQLLAALPEANWQRWLPHLQIVDLPVGKVLHEPGSRLTHVYFPSNSIVSLLQLLEDGDSAEIAVVGHDGMVGISLLMGSESTTTRAVVRSAGRGYRLPADLLQQECLRGGPVLRLLLRYTQALMTQIAQTAICNRHHSLDQQLSRWLLRSLDLTASHQIVITHELIASLLGVRREGVTEAAGRLRESGLISHRRGQITVLDRAGLEERTCECYAAAKVEHGQPQPAMMA